MNEPIPYAFACFLNACVLRRQRMHFMNSALIVIAWQESARAEAWASDYQPPGNSHLCQWKSFNWSCGWPRTVQRGDSIESPELSRISITPSPTDWSATFSSSTISNQHRTASVQRVRPRSSRLIGLCWPLSTSRRSNCGRRHRVPATASQESQLERSSRKIHAKS